LNWRDKEFQLTLNANLPADPTVKFTMNTAKPQAIPIHIRKPYWLQSDAVIKVNGEVVKNIAADKEGYWVVNRKWKKGDVIEVVLPATLHAMEMPDNASRKAFFYGPVLLAGNLGTTEPDPMKGIPVLVTAGSDIKQWLKQDDRDPLTFKTHQAGFPTDVTLQPFYALDDEHYNVYWDVFTPQTWKEQQKVYEEKKKEEYALEQRTTDYIRLGEMQPERDHNFSGEKTEAGESHTRKFRVARDGGKLVFTMKVNPEASHSIIATYWGMDNRGRNFDILVEGEKVGSDDLNKYKDSKFYDISYPIPSKLTKGKNTVTVTFQAKPNNEAGPVYGVRLVKE
jgi:uncharacterized protein